MMSASSCVSAHQAQQLLGDRYVRVTGELPRKLMQLDNTSEARVMDLRSYAYSWFEEGIETIEALIKRVVQAREAYTQGVGLQ